jgi:hypothetical protein
LRYKGDPESSNFLRLTVEAELWTIWSLEIATMIDAAIQAYI